MAQKRKPDQTKLIVRTAMDLAAKNGWGSLSMQAVAKKAKLKPAMVLALFPDKWAVLKWVIKDIEDQTAHDVKSRLGKNWRDNLFEIMMTRIDFALPYKKALSTLPRAFANELRAIPSFARIFWRTMANILKLSHAPGGVKKPLYVAAFGVLYLSVVDVFLKDDTRDQAKTMAALDRRLGHFEQLVEFTDCRKA